MSAPARFWIVSHWRGMERIGLHVVVATDWSSAYRQATAALQGEPGDIDIRPANSAINLNGVAEAVLEQRVDEAAFQEGNKQ